MLGLSWLLGFRPRPSSSLRHKRRTPRELPPPHRRPYTPNTTGRTSLILLVRYLGELKLNLCEHIWIVQGLSCPKNFLLYHQLITSPNSVFATRALESAMSRCPSTIPKSSGLTKWSLQGFGSVARGRAVCYRDPGCWL